MAKRLAVSIHRFLPLGPAARILVKEELFLAFPWAFRRTAAFRRWLDHMDTRYLPPGGVPAPPPRSAVAADWQSLPRTIANTGLPGDPYVVIPVHAGSAETLACLNAALSARASVPYEVVVVADVPADRALRRQLRALAAEGLITLVEHRRRRGFAVSVNQGIALHPGRDVVILQSDAIVHGDWLARLNRSCHAEADVGAVAPLSNNADVASYPCRLENNVVALETDDAGLDQIAAEACAGVSVAAPAVPAVCLYLRRECLDQIGPFAPFSRGRGYGAETHFCRRAAAGGWRHMIAADTYVRHLGGISFGRSRSKAMLLARLRLDRECPDHAEVRAAFVEARGEGPALAALDAGRLRHALGWRREERTVCFLLHALGGGTEKHARDMAAALAREGVRTVLLRSHPSDGHLGLEVYEGDQGLFLPNLRRFLPERDLAAVAAALAVFGVRHLHVHNLAGYGPTAPDWALRLAKALGVGIDVTVHDYTCVCPRANLVDAGGRYCGIAAAPDCEPCIAADGSHFGWVDIATWRQQWARLLTEARRVYVPSADVARRLAPWLPEIAFVERPHFETGLTAIADHGRLPPAVGERLRVTMIGAIGPQKGYELLIACAKDARARGLPIDWMVIGFTCDDARARAAGITVSGRYADSELDGLLAGAGCHLALFASISPETYSYTLSVALQAGLYPVVFDFGAMAARVAELGWGERLAPALLDDAGAVNDRLLTLRWSPPPAAARRFASYPSLWRDYYGWPDAATADSRDAG